MISDWAKKRVPSEKIFQIDRFLDEYTFCTREGGYGVSFALDGIDPESREDADLEGIAVKLARVLGSLPEGCSLFQYFVLERGFEIPHTPCDNPVSEALSVERIEFLDKNAGFTSKLLAWTIYMEPVKSSRPTDKDKNSKQALKDLRQAAMMIQEQLGSLLSIRPVNAHGVAALYGYLLNLDRRLVGKLRSTNKVARQLVRTPFDYEDGSLKLGRRHVRMLGLMNRPRGTRANLLEKTLSMDCSMVLCSVWQARTSDQIHKEVRSQEGFIGMFKHGFIKILAHMGSDKQPEKSAASVAADTKVDDLGAILLDIENNGYTYGMYSLYAVMHSESREEVETAAAKLQAIFKDPADMNLMEEEYGSLSAYYAIFPGGAEDRFRKGFLRNDHASRLAFIYAPNLGETYSDELDAEYMCVYESRYRSPFFYNPYSNGLRGTLIVGAPRRGKSMNGNFHVLHEAKYGGYITIYDVGGSYDHSVMHLGGTVIKIGIDGPRMNPFAVEPINQNIEAITMLVKKLLTLGGATISPQEESNIADKIKRIFRLPKQVRRLSSVVLSPRLQPYLAKWIDGGMYASIFDNEDDQLSLSRIQIFDFQAVSETNQDMMGPVIYWLSHLKQLQWHDMANLSVPKHDLYDEVWKQMDGDMWGQILTSLKTGGKHLGGVTLLTHLVDDLGSHAAVIKNACPQTMFLGADTLNRKQYGEFFKLNEQELDNIESLGPRELMLKTPKHSKVLRYNANAKTYMLSTTKPRERLQREQQRIAALAEIAEAVTA